MEVKPVNVVQRSNGKKEIEKDLKHLTAFRCIPNSGKYHNAIYLIYGSDSCMFDKVRLLANTLRQDYAEEIDLSLIDLYWHPRGGQQAEKQDW